MFKIWTISSKAPSFTYATWNPADKGGNITLTNGNLTAENTASSWNSARSTISKPASSWKHYWEVLAVLTPSGVTTIGIWNSSAGLWNYVGSDANGWSYYSTGVKINNVTQTAYGASYTAGDVIGIALDYSWGTASITFYKNNVSQGVAFSGLSGSLFAMQWLEWLTWACKITANFGATALTYSPPSGFNSWLYN